MSFLIGCKTRNGIVMAADIQEEVAGPFSFAIIDPGGLRRMEKKG